MKISLGPLFFSTIFSIIFVCLFNESFAADIEKYCTKLESVACQNDHLIDASNPYRSGFTRLSGTLDDELQQKEIKEEIIQLIQTGFKKDSQYWELLKDQFSHRSDISKKCLKSRRMGISRACDRSLVKNLLDVLTRPLNISDYEKYTAILESRTTQFIANSFLTKRFITVENRQRFKRLKTALNNVKSAMVDKILQWNIPMVLKKKFIKTIRDVKLVPYNILGKGLGNSGTIYAEFTPNAYYSSTENRIELSFSFLEYSSSEFTQYFVLAHELGHSLDPCSEKKAHQNDKNLGKLNQCIFKNLSIAAKLTRYQGGRAHKKWNCEAFADWFAFEAIEAIFTTKRNHFSDIEWANGYANSLRHICFPYFPFNDLEHPPTNIRIKAFAESHPSYRERLACENVKPTAINYCSL